jgi:hypothetical protein
MNKTVHLVMIILSTSLLSISAMAVDDIGRFEMDANAAEGGPYGTSEDWATLFADGSENGGTPIVFSGILHDHGPLSIFEGGRKDILDLDTWRWKSGSVPDKDDISHAYAAAYRCETTVEGECEEGDIVAYYGADRYSNTGDAYLGFWFFKDNVTLNSDGTFSGSHVSRGPGTGGDILVLVNFPQGAYASPEIRAVEWDTSCAKAEKDVVEGECVAKNLRLLYEGVVCHEVPDDLACAMTNTETLIPNDANGMLPGTIESPWDYQAKTPDPGCAFPYCMPYESFFEGGINLSAFMAESGDTCFASFMVESRSSSSFTATLKDFVLGNFPLCAVTLSKNCGTGEYDTVSKMLKIPFSVTVENTGAATVDSVIAYDDLCGTGEMSHDFGTLVAGESATWADVYCLISPTAFDPPIVNGAWAVTGDEAIPVLLHNDCTTVGDGEVCYDACDFQLDPTVGASQTCEVRLTTSLDEQLVMPNHDVVLVHVLYSGVITNTSSEGEFPVPLINLLAVDDIDGSPLALYDCGDSEKNPLPTWFVLEPGAEVCFEGDYLPETVNSNCASDANFMNVVTVTAEDLFQGTEVMAVAQADCDLCVEDCVQ